MKMEKPKVIISASTPSHGPVAKSKIPLPLPQRSSKIPVPSSKSQPRASLIARLPHKKNAIIQPIVTKRISPKLKEFDIVKRGTKTFVKKKEDAAPKKPIKPGKFQGKSSRQTTLPEKAFFFSRAKKEVQNAPVSNASEKENAPPCSNTCDPPKATSTVKKKELSLVEKQKGLNIQFEASEQSLNQILNNKELTHLELKEASCSQVSQKKGDISDITLEKLKKLSISKTSALFQNSKKTSSRPSNDFRSPSQNLKANQCLPSTRRCTWSSQAASPHAVQAFKSAMSGIKRMTMLNVNNSPLASRLKANTGVVSPARKQLDPYETAMASIRRLNEKKAASPFVSKLKVNSVYSSPSSKPLDAYEEAKRRIEAWKKAKIAQRESLIKKSDSLTSSRTDVCQSPTTVLSIVNALPMDETKSLYRPLKNLTKESSQIQKRLTDISEHTEADSTNSLTSSISEVLKSNTDDLSVDERTSNIGCYDKSLNSLTGSFQKDASDSRFSLYKICLPVNSKVSLTSTAKDSPTSYIHTPRALSFKTSSSSSSVACMPLFVDQCTTSTASHPAPICTPLVLQSIAKKNEEVELLSPIKMKLDFSDEEIPVPKVTDNEKWELRSSLYAKNIITKAKLNDSAADRECCNIMSVVPTLRIFSRGFCNPVAKILTEGDSMHFVPIMAEVAAE